VAVLKILFCGWPLALATAIAGKDRAQPAANVVSPDHDRGFFGLVDYCSANRKRINKSRFNVFGEAVRRSRMLLRSARILRGGRRPRVQLVFAAFSCGLRRGSQEAETVRGALDAIGKVSFAFFIPVYFALVD